MTTFRFDRVNLACGIRSAFGRHHVGGNRALPARLAQRAEEKGNDHGAGSRIIQRARDGYGGLAPLALGLALAGSGAAAETVPVPSGEEVALYDLILEPETRIARFRFLVPAIGPGGPGYAELEADFTHLCESYALPSLVETDWSARQIVISMSDSETEFGVADYEAVQFFEAFRVESGVCVWEQF